jgi:hypothetical protein
MQVDTGEAEGRRDERRGSPAVRAKTLAVEEQLRIEFARTPRCENLAHGGFFDVEKLGHRAQIRYEIGDDADIQIAVRPAIKSMSDTGRERVVDRAVDPA